MNRLSRLNMSSSEHAKQLSMIVRFFLFVVFLIFANTVLNLLINTPILMSLYVIIAFILLQYVTSDLRSWWHKSNRNENRFWIFVSLFFALATLLAPDSPISLFYHLNDAFNENWVLILLLGVYLSSIFSYLIHIFHKLSHRKMLENRPRFLAFQQKAFTKKLRNIATILENEVPTIDMNDFKDEFNQQDEDDLNIEEYETNSIRKNYPSMTSLSSTSSGPTTTIYKSNKNKSTVNFDDLKESSNELGREGKLEIIQKSFQKLDSVFIPQTFRGYLNFDSVLKNERRILNVFRHTTKDELNYLIRHLNLSLLLYKIKNHGKSTAVIDEDYTDMDENIDWGGESTNQHRSDLVDLFARQRVSDLTTTAKASIIDAIMVVRMLHNPKTITLAQKWITNLILTTHDEKLSRLKSMTDSKGSVFTMHKLLYSDIRDYNIRQSLLTHFEKQANRLEAIRKMGGKPAKSLAKIGAFRKVLSDVDDTLLSSGGLYPAGIDKTYPRHCLYPGVICFYKELDLGSHHQVENGIFPQDGSKIGNLAFLSARPHVYKDMAESRVYKKFEKLIHVNNLHTMPMLLPGDLESGQAYMMRGDYEPMAQKKFRNFVEYQSIYPEYTFVFIGDNGQADVRAAQLIKESYKDKIEVMYMHEVQPIGKTYGFYFNNENNVSDSSILDQHEKSFDLDETVDLENEFESNIPLNDEDFLTASKNEQESNAYQLWSELNIVFYKTFVYAAYHACCILTKPLIRPSGLRRIMVNAVSDFYQMKLTDTILKEHNRILLNQDIELANEQLVNKFNLPPVDLIKAECLYKVGTTVYTKLFGEGYVNSFNPFTGTYEVRLTTFSCKISQYCTLFDIKHKPYKKYKNFGNFLATSRYIDEEDEDNKELLRKHSSALLLRSYDKGSSVSTPYGIGTIKRFRKLDKIYEISFTTFKAIGYLNESDVSIIRSKSRSNKVVSLFKKAIWGSSTATKYLNDQKLSKHALEVIDNASIPSDAGGLVVLKNNRMNYIGCQVLTRYGNGILVSAKKIEESDFMCEIKLSWGASLFMLRREIFKPAMNEENWEQLSVGSSMSDSYSNYVQSNTNSPIHSARSSPLGTSYNKQMNLTSPLASLPYTTDEVIELHSEVVTKFGKGKVVSLPRQEDNMVEVELEFGGRAFVNVEELRISILPRLSLDVNYDLASQQEQEEEDDKVELMIDPNSNFMSYFPSSVRSLLSTPKNSDNKNKKLSSPNSPMRHNDTVMNLLQANQNATIDAAAEEEDNYDEEQDAFNAQ